MPPGHRGTRAATAQDVEQTAVRLLAIREHSRYELGSKLCARAFDSDLVERVLQRLVANGLLSDERFTEQYVRSCRGRGLGPVRISAELRRRGIDAESIARRLNQGADDWLDLLRRIHDKKFGSEPATDPREMARRARFLQYRGFPPEQVWRFLKQVQVST